MGNGGPAPSTGGLRGLWGWPGAPPWVASAPRPHALTPPPPQMNLGLIAVVLVAFVSPVVVVCECRRRAKELGAAGTPLTAPPGSETPAEMPQ